MFFFAPRNAFYTGKKSALFSLIFPFTGGFFKIKPILVLLESAMPYLLILLLTLTCSNEEVGANVIISRQEKYQQIKFQKFC